MGQFPSMLNNSKVKEFATHTCTHPHARNEIPVLEENMSGGAHFPGKCCPPQDQVHVHLVANSYVAMRAILFPPYAYVWNFMLYS